MYCWNAFCGAMFFVEGVVAKCFDDAFFKELSIHICNKYEWSEIIIMETPGLCDVFREACFVFWFYVCGLFCVERVVVIMVIDVFLVTSCCMFGSTRILLRVEHGAVDVHGLSYLRSVGDCLEAQADVGLCFDNVAEARDRQAGGVRCGDCVKDGFENKSSNGGSDVTIHVVGFFI